MLIIIFSVGAEDKDAIKEDDYEFTKVLKYVTY